MLVVKESTAGLDAVPGSLNALGLDNRPIPNQMPNDNLKVFEESIWKYKYVLSNRYGR